VPQETRIAGEIQVTVSGVFTTHHFLETVTGNLGELTLSAFGKGGVFRSGDGRALTVERTSWWRSWHELRENEIVLGMASPQSFWRRAMNVGYRGAMYELAPISFWSRGWQLIDEMGMASLEIQPRGVLRRGAYLSILGSVDVDLLVFAYYLVNARWQEHSAAAGAAAGS
jgi:hypothetical protein